MPDFILEFLKWMQNPDILALSTVAGLAAFLKLIAVPAIKYIAGKLGKPIGGATTVWAVYILSFILAEVTGGVANHTITWPSFFQMVNVAVMAAFSALGIQQTTSAIVRPTDKF